MKVWYFFFATVGAIFVWYNSMKFADQREWKEPVLITLSLVISYLTIAAGVGWVLDSLGVI